MSRPEGQARFDRVVMDVGEPLWEALETELVGYGEIQPQAGLFGDGAGRCVLWFDEGVPVSVRHTGTGRSGSEALADIAETGPYRVRLVETADVETVQHGEIPPAAPAERVVGDADLADRTREAADDPEPAEPDAELDAVEAFLADDEKIEAIQKRAAMEARKRAEEWGFDVDEE
ncbi:hypothetical protein RH831_05970 [Halodesulfurarchaeum sp. HSR-GB]|uniref:hypothetical protein n=1 Tax=Halodesulfurarchaeum sp. HSR-GB TaxID=3074077 RepID=UPI002856348E|nr:hypothetical protein [Halodesulfurarchaeum sp. HSR-GB]MDR5656724.1 hypothetical protein [Halodesulfurarchaeum sp. HSR-GB]